MLGRLWRFFCCTHFAEDIGTQLQIDHIMTVLLLIRIIFAVGLLLLLLWNGYSLTFFTTTIEVSGGLLVDHVFLGLSLSVLFKIGQNLIESFFHLTEAVIILSSFLSVIYQLFLIILLKLWWRDYGSFLSCIFEVFLEFLNFFAEVLGTGFCLLSLAGDIIGVN